MAKITPLAKADLPESLRMPDGSFLDLSLFRALAHAPPIAVGVMQLGEIILSRTKVAPDLREIAILRVAYRSRSGYEAHHHEKIGRQLGLDDSILKALQSSGGYDGFDEPARLIVQLTDELMAGVSPDAATLESAIAEFGPREVVEITVTVGYYMMLARFLDVAGLSASDAAAEPPPAFRGSKPEVPA